MLSNKAFELLKWLGEEGEDELGYERELVREKRIWMAGVKRVSQQTAMELLMHCCISADQYSDEGFERFAINGTGRQILADPVEGCKRVQGLLSGEIKE